jgi:DNA (cytosine-5)-methyltransferase 1
MNYYNEWDQYAAQWLRNLIAAGHIPAGDVDTRSICDISPSDLAGYTQCHFFAGIGGWSRALALAGWPADRPVWTGSCPCQPFSNAGARKGTADDRHLWPYWYELIRQCRPPVVFGEQVESAIAHGWLDLVQADVEREGYAFAAAGIPAAGVGAPHGRHRLWFVADAMPAGRAEWRTESGRGSASGLRCTVELADAAQQQHDGRGDFGAGRRLESADGGYARALADDDDDGQHRQPVAGLRRAEVHDADGCGAFGVGDAPASGRPGASGGSEVEEQRTAEPGATSHWSDCDWLPCTDGKARPVEPGTFPLAHGVSNRVGRLRAYGNAIVPQVAAAFIGAYVEGVQ